MAYGAALLRRLGSVPREFDSHILRFSTQARHDGTGLRGNGRLRSAVVETLRCRPRRGVRGAGSRSRGQADPEREQRCGNGRRDPATCHVRLLNVTGCIPTVTYSLHVRYPGGFA